MAIETKSDIMRLHSQLHLKLIKATIGTYPIHLKKASTANRILFVFADSGQDDSYIYDPATDIRHSMRSGNLYFIPCGHIVDQCNSAKMQYVALLFDLDFFYGFDIMSKFPECRAVNDKELVEEVKQLLNSPNLPLALCRINEIIYHLCHKWLSEKPEILTQNLKDYSAYQTILDYVEQHGSAQTTVGMLAELLKMRQDVFSRKFTREIGISPKDFITRTLIRKASFLLGSHDILVREAADQLKFNSEYYFSRFFKHHTGMSPKEFQRFSGIN